MIGTAIAGGLAGAAIVNGGQAAHLVYSMITDSIRDRKNKEDYENYLSNRTSIYSDGEKIWDSVSGCCGSATWLD